MTTDLRALCLAAAVTGILTAGPVQAQGGPPDLSAEEVKDFFESAEQSAMRAVQRGEYARLLDWARDHVAEGATFMLSQEVYVGNERKGFAVTSADKQDVLGLGRLAVGVMSNMPSEAVQDYSLKIEVTNVDPIGPNAATATTQITERGTFAPPGGKGTQQAGSEPIEIEATAECSHLVRRVRDADHLAIGMTSCQATVRL